MDKESPSWKLLNERWNRLVEVFEHDLDYFINTLRVKGNLNISVKLYKYDHMPNWHGWLINHKHLFLGACMWDSEESLTAGQNIYEYYSAGKSDIHNHKIKIYRRWFNYGRYHGSGKAILFDSKES